jgi:hypothetical protein
MPFAIGTDPIYCSSSCGNKAWIRAHRVQYLEKARLRSRRRFDSRGFSNPGSRLRLKTVHHEGQDRIADALWLERNSGKTAPGNKAIIRERNRLPNASWRFQGDSGRARKK